jgi:hypothetical protein
VSDLKTREHRFVVVLARDHHDLVPDFRIDDPLAVQLSSKVNDALIQGRRPHQA